METLELENTSNTCEHDINLVDERWMSESTVLTTAVCCKCGSKFTGILIKN